MRPGPTRFWQSSVRRPSFWLGLFVACFLAWAWWDSFNGRFIAWIPRDGKQVEFEREAGATHIAFLTGLGSLEEASFHYETRDGDDLPYAEFLDIYGASYCRVPDSLVFVFFLGLWGGWLGWRWRVERRFAKEPP
jgi:hypothetical protein